MLTFLYSSTAYKAGGTYDGQPITKVWYGTDITASGINTPAWNGTVRNTLTTVKFDASLKSNNVKPTSCNGWFYNCTKLQTITGIANLNMANVTSMGSMFSGCSSLTSLNLSSFNTANVTNMSNMFAYCSSLTSLTLSSFNTASVTNMSYMFKNCISLTPLILSSFNTANVTDYTDYTGMFSYVPEQCFIYMPANTMDEIKNLRSQNLVLKDGDTWTCANTVLEDGSTLMLPYGFTATGGVTYERNIPANTGNAYTVFLPYDCPIPEGVTAYTLRTDEQELMAEQKIVFEPVENTMEAYTPYLIVNNGDEALTNLSTTVDTQVLSTSTSVNEKTFGDLRFTGTVSTISNEDASTTGAYILQSDNSWKKVVTSSPNAYIPAYRAYIVSASSNANIWESLLDSETTSIESFTLVPSPKGEGSYYTLDGRRVTNPQKGSIYIVNGRKFVWK